MQETKIIPVLKTSVLFVQNVERYLIEISCNFLITEALVIILDSLPGVEYTEISTRYSVKVFVGRCFSELQLQIDAKEAIERYCNY